jgi:hypothetical protein
MRLSSSFVVPSAVAALSTVLLCGPAAPQTAPGSAAPLPTITVEAPKRMATPHSSKQMATTVPSRRISSAPQTPSSTAQTPSAAQGPIMQRIAKLERAASSCNGGCATSFKSGNAPWVGCSESGGWNSTFSSTCTDTLTYKSYMDCRDTKTFLGWEVRKVIWYCNVWPPAGSFRSPSLNDQDVHASAYLPQTLIPVELGP